MEDPRRDIRSGKEVLRVPTVFALSTVFVSNVMQF